MKKFTKLIATATAALLALGFAGCTENDSGIRIPVTYPVFINSTESGNDQEQVSEKYVVNVLSEGGMKLDGVQVSLKRGDTVVKRGISKDGKIEFATGLGDYELVVDETTLPAGYYLNGTTYRTNPAKRDEVNIRIPSKLLPPTASVSSFAVGNVMRDFTFTDVDNGTHTLSTLLQTKKAVVLNFFFSTCGPCNNEFPALQSSYASRKASMNDIEVLGICAESTSSSRDTNETVANKKIEHGLTFPVGLDSKNILCSSFGVRAFPTTVVIDRYGLIAYRESNSQPSTGFWSQLFTKFAANDYVQDVSGSSESGNQGTSSGYVKPTEEMPASAVLEQAALDNAKATFRAEEDGYSWPWKAGTDAEGSYIYSSNTGVGNTYATVHADIPIKKDELLSFEYKISSEAGADYLYVLLNGAQMNTGYSGGDGNWHTVNLYVSDRDKTVDLAFVYRKDQMDPETGVGDDVAKIRNINVSSDSDAIAGGAPLDVMRECASGETAENKYEYYVDAVYNPADGFYHKDTVNGPLIYMTINQLTPWCELHTGKTSQAADGTTYSNTLFQITAQKYLKSTTNENEETEISVVINGKDVTRAYTEYVLIMSYMPAPYYLIPVTEPLKEWAEAVINDYEKGAPTENEWLEFCYYYAHYGVEHDDPDKGDNQSCKVDVDYTRGLTTYNAYTAYEKGDSHLSDENLETLGTNGRNKAWINYPLQLTHNGTYYRFTATKSGVYQIRSYTKGCSPTTTSTADNADSYVTAEPALTLYNGNGEYIRTVDEVFDHDAFKTEIYEGFNTYVAMEEGEEIILYLETTQGTKSYYDFEITYHESPYEKMMVCSRGGGAWTWVEMANGSTLFTYIGIKVMYDETTDCYYAVKDGKADHDQPVYIDMYYSSYFMCEIKDYYFATLQYMIEDGAFNNLRFGATRQATMEKLLGTALNKPKDDPLYGLVPATSEVVEIINQYIDEHGGGRGDGNGWLAFAVYNAKLG